MKGWQIFLISIPSIIIAAEITTHFYGDGALMGMASGVILFTWIRFLYDKMEQKKNAESLVAP